MAEQKGVMLQPSGTGPVVGIDLGTTYSVVAMHRRGKVEIFSNDNGSRTTPSIVGFLEGEAYIGDAAKDLPASRQVYDAKRMLGRPWKDEKLQSDRQAWPFDVVEDNGAPRIKVDVDDGRTEMFAPEQISAMVLQNLKETAESALGEPVSRAVITVPAYFDERQRQATRDAGRIAGLEVVAMINEPTAGAIAYGLDKKSEKKKTVFIYDLGGGTFDVSVMTIEGNDFKVLASDGDTHLGGQDFDRRLLTHCIADIRKQHGVDLMAQKEDMQTLQDLRKACELAKRKLSNLPEASLSTFLTRQQIGYSTKISRARFEELCADLFKKTVEISNQVLADAKVSRSAIDEVVLVGGSTRIPKVCALLTELFGKEPRKSINPDEAVAYGAAVHAAVLSGDKFLDNLVKLKDVTPLSLGVEILGGRFSVMIKKNSPVPVRNTQRYYSVQDNQKACGSNVYQGERPLVKDNHCLNKEFSVDVPPKPAGQASIDVTFEIDTDGLLTVTAVEPTTKKQAQVKITQREAHLSDKDIQDMIEKARSFQRQDAEELKRIEEALRKQRMF